MLYEKRSPDSPAQEEGNAEMGPKETEVNKVVRMIKSRKLRRRVYITKMVEYRSDLNNYQVIECRERNLYEDLDVKDKAILECALRE